MVLQASEEELKSVLDGPAVYSNRFFVSIGAVVAPIEEQLAGAESAQSRSTTKEK